MNKEICMYVATQEATVTQILKQIDIGERGIVFVVDNNEKLVGCATDGDIRRWLIKTANLEASVSECMYNKPKYLYDSDKIDRKKYMLKYSINALPIVDVNMHIKDIVFLNEMNVQEEIQENTALQDVVTVIMAGGKGTRLYPYTKILPKPLIPIGDIPIIERIMMRFLECGAKKFYLTVNYKKNMIKSYFDENPSNYEIIYVEENKPLGTGGSLKLIKEKFDKPIFVTNCDILIQAKLEDIYKQHIALGNAITIVAALKNITIPYGVIKVKEQGQIEEMQEKPSLSHFVNTGMYVVNPELLELIPEDTFYHMPQLAEEIMSRGMKVGIYPISEDAFLDMGELEEMRRMEEKLNV